MKRERFSAATVEAMAWALYEAYAPEAQRLGMAGVHRQALFLVADLLARCIGQARHAVRHHHADAPGLRHDLGLHRSRGVSLGVNV